MPIFDFKCSKCGFQDEYIESFSVPKEMKAPKICPKCNEGEMEKQFSSKNIGIDFIGSGFFINDYGKHNWKKGKTPDQIADYLVPDKTTGRYKDPY